MAQLKERVKKLEALLSFVFSDHLDLSKNIRMQDGRNIQVGRGTGTRIGTATDQKISFYGVTPVDQPATVSDASGCTGDADDKVNLVIDRLQELGLIA